jgi:tetratricopeptide (TPR) repeat protein
MRANVFTDATLTRHAGQFVWLALDLEKPENAKYRERLAVNAYPSFFIVDPKTEKIALRWVGGATAPQMEKVLLEGRAAVREKREKGLPLELAEADRLYGEANYGKAADAYAKVLARAPSRWEPFGRVADSYLFALSMSDRNADCAQFAARSFAKVLRGPSAANVAGSGLDCALGLPASNPDRARLVSALEKDGREALARPESQFAADDRSSLYEELIAAREDAHDEQGKKALERDWVAMLERAAARAPTPEARAVYDSHRLSAYLEIGEPQRAIPMLEDSERDLPNDYDPPARLAIAYKAMGEYDKALAASDRALAMAYGPRKIGFFRTRAEIYDAKGDFAAEKKTLRDAIAYAESLPKEQQSDRAVASLRKKLEELEKKG